MATITITNNSPTLRNLRAILSRVDAEYGLVWTENKNAVHGTAITASIDFEEDAMGKRPVSVTISSSYYAPYTLQQTAEKAKGKGWISHKDGKEVSYYVEYYIGYAGDGQGPNQTVYYKSEAEALSEAARYEGNSGDRAKPCEVVGEDTFDLHTGENVSDRAEEFANWQEED